MNKKAKTILITIVALAAVVATAAVYLAFQKKSTNIETVRIYVPQEAADYHSLCDSLQRHGVTGSMFWMHAISKTFGLTKNVRAGSYLIKPGTSLVSMVHKIYRNEQDPIKLTIGKMRTAEQLNEYLSQHLMHNDFDFTTDDFCLLHPDTYEIYWTTTPERLRHRLEREDQHFWERSGIGETAICGEVELTRCEIIILASIIEDETNHNPEKAEIAGVYLNRMKRGMALQADPTVKYAVGDFTLQRILNEHLKKESPYNTYLHTGLPPTPICLPSKTSVMAVIKPKKTDALYFCASDAMDGTHRFAATLTEHNRNAHRFHQALNRRGIKK